MKFPLLLTLGSLLSVASSSCKDDTGAEVLTCVPSTMSASPRAPLLAASIGKDYIPTVFMHGLGDSGSNRGMQNLAKTVPAMYPGAYSIAVDVANGMSSYTEDIAQQVAEFAKVVQGDAKLSRGFNAVGLSQGGLIVRAYAEMYNSPPVHNLLSLCGPQGGVGDCPGGTPAWMCNAGKEVMYGAGFSFSGYWKDVDGDAASMESKYLEKSTYLADINNDRDVKNSTYVNNMMSVNKYVMVEALEDTVVFPHESEMHGFYAWGDLSTVVSFRDTEGYKGNFVGLKSMDEAKKVDTYTYVGDHLRWTDEFWTDTVLPYLGDEF